MWDSGDLDVLIPVSVNRHRQRRPVFTLINLREGLGSAWTIKLLS